jgi:tetratricopeptide (TPR) repeat protein
LLHAANAKDEQWPAWLVDLALDESRFVAAIQVLIRYSLIEAQEGAPGFYSMHPTVHQWSSNHEERSQSPEFARPAAMVTGMSVSLEDTPEGRMTRQMLWPHARLCAGWLKSHPEAAGISALDAIRGLAALLEDQGDVSDAQDMYELGLTLAERSLESNDTTGLSLLYGFASLKQSLGETEGAEKMLLRVLSGTEAVPPPENTLTLDTLQCLGFLYEDQEDFPKAEAMYRRALFGKERALGRHDPSTLETVSCLGCLYRRQDRLDDATGMYGRLLAGYGAAFGTHHPLRLEAAEDLGQLLRAQGRTEAAEELRLRMLKETHPSPPSSGRQGVQASQRKATSLSECKTLKADGDDVCLGEKGSVLKRVGTRLTLMLGKVL